MYEASAPRGERLAPGLQLRELWDAREPMVGGWCLIPSPFCAEVMAAAGFDWICIDTQHGLIGYSTMLAMLQAVDGRRVPALVRVAWNDPSMIMKALDAGSAGVIVPMVNSAVEAEAAAKACRYPPEGFRSWGPTRAALSDVDFTPEVANRRVVCVVMVETVEAVRRVHEIAAVPGVDGIFIGPWDLSLSAGGDIESPGRTTRDIELIESVSEACRREGVIAGVACGAAEDVHRWREAGFLMFSLLSDVALLSGAGTTTLAAARMGA
jgi:4-hydroxy-2-oxoheptanedioate aldolase